MSPQPDPAALAQLQSRLQRAAAFCGLQSHGAKDEGVRAEWLAHEQACRDAATALDQHAATVRALEEARDAAIIRCKTAETAQYKAEADREAHAEALKAMTAERDEQQILHQRSAEQRAALRDELIAAESQVAALTGGDRTAARDEERVTRPVRFAVHPSDVHAASHEKD